MGIFNRALLAKQGWRILQYPELLAAKVLKAKYFLRCNFLEAKQSDSSSFLWSSILYGRKLLCKGVKWRIGDGTKVHVFKDP